jgi:hypothetical protein
MSFETRSTNPAVLAVVSGKAPQPVRLAAARGVLPLSQRDLMEVLVGLAEGPDPELARIASQTIASQDNSGLETLIRSNEVSPSVLAHLIKRPALPNGVYEALIINISTPQESVIEFTQGTKSGPLWIGDYCIDERRSLDQ